MLLRFGIGRLLSNQQWAGLPIATAFVNLAGCFLIGYLAAHFAGRTSFSAEMQTIIITGFLGGFTTFSAFSLEAISLFEDGAGIRALFYVCIQVVLCLMLCFAGFVLARQ